MSSAVAMDCEMVGINKYRRVDMIARVSVVNEEGTVLLDKYVKPRHEVTDYRTAISGVRPEDLEKGEDFDEVQRKVAAILKGRILVGHGVDHDLEVMKMKHPLKSIRDTSEYQLFKYQVGGGRKPSLKKLALRYLHMEIQSGEHDSVEDARVVMKIYMKHKQSWERKIHIVSTTPKRKPVFIDDLF